MRNLYRQLSGFRPNIRKWRQGVGSQPLIHFIDSPSVVPTVEPNREGPHVTPYPPRAETHRYCDVGGTHPAWRHTPLRAAPRSPQRSFLLLCAFPHRCPLSPFRPSSPTSPLTPLTGLITPKGEPTNPRELGLFCFPSVRHDRSTRPLRSREGSTRAVRPPR